MDLHFRKPSGSERICANTSTDKSFYKSKDYYYYNYQTSTTLKVSQSESALSRTGPFRHVMPLHCPQASEPWSPFFLHEHVFLSQLPVQSHWTIFRRKAGAAACSILFGFKIVPSLVLLRTHHHSVASMMFPNQVCTWW